MDGDDRLGLPGIGGTVPLDRAWALFLDVDGTLLDIAERPDEVRVPSRLIDDLARLAERLGGALALVSGRPVASLDALFAPLVLPAAGQHGAEIRMKSHSEVSVTPPVAALAGVADGVLALARRWPGVTVEDKGNAVAVHYRLAPAAREPIAAALRRIADRLGHEVELLDGKMVFELRERGVTKGSAVRAFMAHPPFAGRCPVFIGDDVTDEDGFRAVEAAGGIALPVGAHAGAPRRPAFADPAAVRSWLADRANGAR
ncbi:MAG: trehalose-phosphatase [Alphaproteobacteria bacterium]